MNVLVSMVAVLKELLVPMIFHIVYIYIILSAE